MWRGLTAGLFGLCQLGVGLSAETARADVEECASAHAAGQRAVNARQLKNAVDLFAICRATEGCPEAIREECIELHRDVERSVPSVIFAATDARGQDITQARVYAGEVLLATQLDGHAIALDPGRHQFRFVFADGEVLTSVIVVREGEKNRVVSARPPNPQISLPPTLAEAASTRRTPTAAWVATAVSAAGLASFGVFAIIGKSQQSEVDKCSPNCSPSVRDNYDEMKRDYLVADISLGVAAVSAGLATWFFLSAPSTPTQSNAARSSVRVSVRPSVSGAQLVIGGSL